MILRSEECYIEGGDAFRWFYGKNKHHLKSPHRLETIKELLHWRKKRGKKLLLRGDFGIIDIEDKTYFMSKSTGESSYTSQTLKLEKD